MTARLETGRASVLLGRSLAGRKRKVGSSIIDKSVALMEVLGDASRPLGFTALVNASGLNKSSVHRLLTILIDHRLVQYDERGKTYMLGPKLLQLAKKARAGYDLQSVAYDEMQELFQSYGENVTLGVLKGSSVAYIRTIEAYHDWSILQAPGLREPFHSTATGKVLVAFLSAKARTTLLDDYTFTRYTERTIVTRDDFEQELASVRYRGYGTSDRENVAYVNGIAVPIFNYIGEPIAALNIWAPAFRHDLTVLLGWVDALKSAAHRISETIGSSDTPFQGFEYLPTGPKASDS